MSRFPGPGGAGGSVSRGAQGPMGLQGIQGTTGPAGEVGLQGIQGSIGPTGSQGPEGKFGGFSVEYIYVNNTIIADPGDGNIRLNNSNLANATYLAIDDNNDAHADIHLFLRTIDDSTSTIKGQIKITKKTDDSIFFLYSINSMVDNETYFRVTISNLGHNGNLTNGDQVLLTFARTGDKGDTGAQGVQGSIGATGPAGDSLTPRGNWSSNTNYSVNDVVYHSSTGTSYVAAQPGTNHTPSSSSSYWTVVSHNGTDGINGTDGKDGAQGIQGVQGAQGRQGTQGFGYAQAQGTQGIQGSTGSGAQGVQGIQGRQGTQGFGYAQLQGIEGPQGPQGTQGIQGPSGTSASDNIHTFRTTIPSLPTSTGIKGEWAVDSTYLYICYATNSWRRIALTSWTTSNPGGSN